ncbi:MAG: 50S ribosomal protein L15 [Gemmatimonadetes bacterium]|nr:50S ribosomal protein L15 [Gemmatimonadota bacterium]
MAELHDLRPAAGSHQRSKRKGRGPGSGKGKTAGSGENGQKSRSGGSVRPGFEGGQMPLQRRIPKRGFTPRKRKIFQIVNVGDLARVEGSTVNAQTLKDAGLIRSVQGLVKVLAMGDLSQAYSVEAHKFSGGAVAKIEAAGGSVTTVGPAVAKAEPEVAVKPETAAEPEVAVEPEAAAEPEVVAEPEAAAEPEAETETEDETEIAAEPEPEAESEEETENNG